MFLDYADDPEAWWPAGRQRQAVKLRRALRDRSAKDVVDVAEARALDRPPTVFLLSCGSSGSHWLEAMLAQAADVRPCGEVYVPAAMLAEMRRVDAASRSALLDCVHLAHSDVDASTGKTAVLVNSAHASGWRLRALMQPPHRTVLLVRDPADIVISRTFRKGEYRADVSPASSDEEYLEDNLAYVDGFYDIALRESVDAVVSYEQLREDAVAALTRVFGMLGVEPVTVDPEVRANKYDGPAVTVPDEVRASVVERTADLRRRIDAAVAASAA